MSEQALTAPAKEAILTILQKRKTAITEILGKEFDVQRYGRLIINGHS
jgi:hypothetical protein